MKHLNSGPCCCTHIFSRFSLVPLTFFYALFSSDLPSLLYLWRLDNDMLMIYFSIISTKLSPLPNCLVTPDPPSLGGCEGTALSHIQGRGCICHTYISFIRAEFNHINVILKCLINMLFKILATTTIVYSQ